MTRARYIENGFAKVAPCTCSTSAIHEKGSEGADMTPIWRCRNCGATTKRRARIAGAVKGTGGLLRLDAEGNLL